MIDLTTHLIVGRMCFVVVCLFVFIVFVVVCLFYCLFFVRSFGWVCSCDKKKIEGRRVGIII